jgi:hypothetical protein
MRELRYVVVVENGVAKANLAEVDRAIDRVDASAVRAGRAVDATMAKTADEAQRAAVAMARTRENLERDISASSKRIDALIAKQDADRDRLAAKHERQREREAAAARREETRMAKAAEQADSSLAALGRRVVAVFAVDSLAAYGKQLVANATHVQELSQRLGIGVDMVQELGFAAARGGTSIDTMATSIATMSRNLVSGNAGAVAALRQLGLEHQALMQQRPEEAFTAIAEAIRQMHDPMERMNTVQRIFGEQGAEILPTIMLGLRGLRQEARDFGVTMDADVVRTLTDAGHAWATFQRQGESAFSTILARAIQTYQWIRENGPGAAAKFAGEVLSPSRGSATGGVGWSPDTAFYRTGGIAGPFGVAANLGMAMGAVGAMNTPASASAEPWLRGRITFGSDRYGAAARYGRGMDDTDLRAIALQGLGPSLEIPERALASRRQLASVTETAEEALAKLTASTVAYLKTVMPAIGLGSTVSSLERAAAYRGTLAGAGAAYLQTGIAGAFQPDPYAGITIDDATHPYSMVGLQQSVQGRRGLSAGLAPTTPRTGFWDGRGGQAAAAGIGIAGSAAMGAMTGGDQYASLVGAGASAVSYAALSGTMSAAALGAATMGIGAAAVGVYLLARHFFTVSKEVKQARTEVDAFQQSLRATMTAQQVNEAAGENWAATTIVVRDAFTRMGKSAGEAETLVGQLLDTDRPDQARTAMARINDVVSDYRAILAGVNEQMGDLLGQATTLGQKLPQALLDSLNAAAKLGDMTEENARLIASLTQAPAVDFKAFEAAADRYGINKDALGQAFQQNRTTTTAQQMIDDVDLLREGGATMGTIIHGMREEISALVQDSLKFGTELPGNMRPWIDELFNTKQLVDANGEALTDIMKLSFGEDLQTTFQNVAKAIMDLVDTLKGPLSGALDEIGKKVIKPTVDVQFTGGGSTPWDGGGRPEPESAPEGYRFGGVVYAAQGWPFVPKGTDTVPAMLTPGEGVLSRRGMAMLGTLNGGGSGGGASIDYDRLASAMVRAMTSAGIGTLNVDGRELAGALVPHIGGELEFQGAWK